MDLYSKVKSNYFCTFFLYPFTYNHKLGLNKIVKIFEKQSNKWNRKKHELTTGKEYNEFLYFYPHIRDILYSNFHNNSIVCFEYILDNDLYFYEVENNEGKEKFSLSLPLTGISLFLFENCTGILTFKIKEIKENRNIYEYIQFLNMGRRIYPSFVDPLTKLIEGSNQKQLFKTKDLNAIKKHECARKISIKKNENDWITHDFQNIVCKIPKQEKVPFISNIITEILDTKSFNFSAGDYQSIVDDRMFSLSYYSISNKKNLPFNSIFIDDLKKYFNSSGKDNTCIEAAKLWYTMIFIDQGGPACQNHKMFDEILDYVTYKRWTDFGSFFGFSRYSAAIISNFKEALFIKHHFETMYYKIALLLFFYRGSLLTFSKRTIKISEQVKKGGSFKELQKLQEDFLLFENKYKFKEVTAQEQGIEIFDLWEEKMRNHLLLTDVKQGIQELFTYFAAKNEKRTARIITALTIFGGIILPISLAVDLIAIDKNANALILNFIGKILQQYIIEVGWGISILVLFSTLMLFSINPVRNIITLAYRFVKRKILQWTSKK